MPAGCALCGATYAREIFRTFRPRTADATGRHTEDLFGRAGKLLRCTRCTLVRQEDGVTAPYEDAEDLEYVTEERGIRHGFRNILDRIEQHRAPPGRLLDTGCGPGLLLDEARSRGWDTAGVEPSAWSVEQARRLGLAVTQGALETTTLQAASFDAAVAADVIEHVVDPLAFARRIHDLLVPGGVVFVATPNIDGLPARILRRWWWSVIPNHLWFFSPSTLEPLLRKAGLEPVETTTNPKTFSVEYYAGRFGGYRPGLGKALRRASRLFGGRDRLITPDFRDRVAVVAIKPEM